MGVELTGKVAVVTGASGGLGAHFARLLAANGAAVAVTARRVDKIQAIADEINAGGGKALALSLDVGDAEAIGPALDRVQAELGGLDILVNNAGIGGEGLALDISVEDFDQTFAVNVRGTFFAAREAARRMIAAKVEGRIVNIASIASHTVLPGLSAYCGSKAAVAMLTKSLAREWARRGIAVNALAPGYIETAINDAWWPTEGGQKQLKGFPRRRLMDASDLDEAFLLLAGPAASAITGTLITVDDGQSLPGGG
ncbi:MAG: short-chain dehydrogenase [Phenylobacterium sp. RIFCSPHIGHO2_01_FULL_69_31]|uniref:SDR family NAD(P)-dependent oxidoreductase n=1 Tax=Phenylobacterium sp. RIFCSPHIGHO2_01_FULL_69_31 TaxID=1801944 RepID=UPI0008B556C1|nr:SDR family NAD(P)-dependent oxidoreductase [Phenylobacterium sp. RIFCSPHIGHO2_01_FULL_69_31]OHB28164.1 MAG: short-chain dehydrogenase [Phenylobacterium sp. RIFCSPHIGHO2_01_FULL_69_31]